MAITQTFTRTLPTPSATHSNGFVFLLSTGWFTQADGVARGSPIDGGTYSIANGGGNLQAYSDEACTVRVPVEVVEFVTGGTPSAIVWVRLPTWTAGDKITIAKNTSQTVQPAVTDTYGRNAVWQDFELVIHQGTSIDSAGNHTPSITGTPTLVTAKWGGQAYNFTGDDAIIVPHSAALNFTSGMYLSAWADINNSLSEPAYILDKVDDNTDGYRIFKREVDQSYRFRTPTTSPSNLDSSALTTGEEKVDVTLDGLNKDVIVNGVTVASASFTGSFSGNIVDLSIGNSSTPDQRPFTGWLGEVWLSSIIPSNDLKEDARLNQNDPDNFGTSSEWADFGGGTTIQESISFNSVSQHEISNNALMSASITAGSISTVNNQTQITLNASIVATTSANFSLSTSATLNGTLEVDSSPAVLMQNIVQAQANLLINSNAGFILSLGNAIQESLSFNSVAGDSANINVTFAGELIINSVAAVDLINKASMSGQLNIGSASAMSLVTSAIMSAGLDFSSISNVELTPSGIIVDITTPDSRTLTIAISDREFKITATNRETTVTSNDRTFDVPQK